jgi:hypothetical protein
MTGTSTSAITPPRPYHRLYTHTMGDHHREPFRPWAAERAENTCFDMSRFDAIPPGTHGGNRYRGREAAWEARRKHSPCPLRIIPSWGMDCIFLRTPSEADYVKALWAYTAQNPAVGEVIVCREYLMESKPFLPLPWPPSGRKSSNPEAEFSQKGQLLVPPERYPRDSSYALYLGSLMAGHGDPGRFVEEYRKEHKNRRRGVLLSWAQVEYYQVPQGMKRVLYPPTPEGWADWECPVGMIVPLPAVVHYRGSRLVRGDPLHWGIFYSEWVVNVVGRFVADAHHRGVLWKLPERVVDSIPLLGLEYLLEGSPYNVDTVKQLLQTQKEYDWLNWGHKGYHEVGGVPVQLVGSQYLVQDLPPVTVTNPPGAEVVEVEEEIVAQGTIPSVVVQRSPAGERGGPRVGNLLPSLVIDEPRKGAPDSGYPGNISWMDYGESGPGPSGGVGASSRYYPRGGEPISRTTIPSTEVMMYDSDAYYGYTGEDYDREHSQAALPVSELESQLSPGGMLQEFRELLCSAEWTPVTVGQAIRRLLESRRNHRYQARMQEQRISRLESALESRATHDRGTARRLNQMVGELASLSVRCHEGPSGDTQARDEEEEEGEGRIRKRQRGEDGDGWESERPRG